MFPVGCGGKEGLLLECLEEAFNAPFLGSSCYVMSEEVDSQFVCQCNGIIFALTNHQPRINVKSSRMPTRYGAVDPHD